jgi:glycosyltransferase involved in cell wall biosynthesis
MKLSVVMPVYNEEATLREIVARVLATPYEKELILVDDCSQDSSPEIIAELEAAHPEVRAFRHETNSGKGAALRTGFQNVEGDAVVIQEADVVYGSRFLGGAYTLEVNFWRYHGNRTLTRVSNLFTGLRLTDMETCYKLMRADVARDLDIKSRTFTVEPEMTAKFARRKLRVVEVPISYDSRGYDEGKKIGLKDAFLAIGAIVRFRFFA